MEVAAELTKARAYRWLVDVSQWNPSEIEFQKVLSLAQPEEQTRIKRFHFPIDAKRSLIGRLLIRGVLALHFGMDETQTRNIKLTRTEAGKPIWEDERNKQLFFNVSHHSKFVLLVADTTRSVGCDIMSIEITGKDKDPNKFLDLMQGSFTRQEKAIWERRPTEHEQLSQFFTLWTLKEAYIKNVGMGLQLELQRMKFFYVDPARNREFGDKMALQVIAAGDKYDMDASVYDFEHYSIDPMHTASVCLGPVPPGASPMAPPPFRVVSFPLLMSLHTHTHTHYAAHEYTNERRSLVCCRVKAKLCVVTPQQQQ